MENLGSLQENDLVVRHKTRKTAKRISELCISGDFCLEVTTIIFYFGQRKKVKLDGLASINHLPICSTNKYIAYPRSLRLFMVRNGYQPDNIRLKVRAS